MSSTKLLYPVTPPSSPTATPTLSPSSPRPSQPKSWTLNPNRISDLSNQNKFWLRRIQADCRRTFKLGRARNTSWWTPAGRRGSWAVGGSTCCRWTCWRGRPGARTVIRPLFSSRFNRTSLSNNRRNEKHGFIFYQKVHFSPLPFFVLFLRLPFLKFVGFLSKNCQISLEIR